MSPNQVSKAYTCERPACVVLRSHVQSAHTVFTADGVLCNWNRFCEYFVSSSIQDQSLLEAEVPSHISTAPTEVPSRHPRNNLD